MPKSAKKFDSSYNYTRGSYLGDGRKYARTRTNEAPFLNVDYSRYSEFQTSQNAQQNGYYSRPNSRYEMPVRRSANQKKVRLNNLIHKFISISVIALIGCTILPTEFERITKPLFIGTPHKNIKMDYEKLLFPATNALANHWFMGEDFLISANAITPQMKKIPENYELKALEQKLNNLSATYAKVHPAVYVWDFETGNYADINADEIFSTASIIKLPVLVELFRRVDRGEISLDEKMTLTDYYRAEGSGGLQYKAENSTYSIDNLARIMITDSDNSATNMLVSKLGSMTAINRAMREWGLEKTYLETWLPDMTGNNRTTAREMGQILYNIENDEFLSDASREKVYNYMTHVHNNRLIGAGLPVGAKLAHKTGDIGKMLGDVGIVTAKNGKKYIVVILANRPHNSPLGKEFIVKASEIIYQSLGR